MPRVYRLKTCPVCFKEHRGEYEVCSWACSSEKRKKNKEKKDRMSIKVQYRQTGTIEAYEDEFLPPMQEKPQVMDGDIWEEV